MLKGELLRLPKGLTFEQASPGSAISKLKILVSHVRERLKARAAAWQRSVI